MVLSVGVAGLGAIGSVVARSLAVGLPGLELRAVATSGSARSLAIAEQLEGEPSIVSGAELADICDVVVDCAPPDAFPSIAVPALQRGRILVTVSGAAILNHPVIADTACFGGGRIILVSGALAGLDAVRAAAEGEIRMAQLITRKPPASFAKASYVRENGIDLAALSEPLLLFRGSARDGAKAFPSNVNVAASLSLAGIGPDRTQLEIWADPALTRNIHRVRIEADVARLDMIIENVPSPDNPGSAQITALSVVATLRGLTAPLRAGA